MEHGALCAMTDGTLLTPMWCVVSLVTPEPHLHFHLLTLVKAVVPSTMMTLLALGVRHAWLTAPIAALALTIAVTMKMQE